MKRLHITTDTFAKISRVENISLSNKAKKLFADFKIKNTPHADRRKQIIERFAKS